MREKETNMSRIVKAAFGVVLIAVMAVTFAHADGPNAWQPFYNDAPLIRVKSPGAAVIGSVVGEQDTLTIGLPDVALFAGEVCPGVASAYMLTREALSALYRDGTPTRGQIRVAASTHRHRDRLDVASFITGARSGFGNAGDAIVDPSLASEDDGAYIMVFQRKDTGSTVLATFTKSELIPVERQTVFRAFKGKVARGEASDDEKKQTWDAIQSYVELVLTDTPEGVIEIEPLDGYDFPEVEGGPHHDHHH
jgi:hypothetical protein